MLTIVRMGVEIDGREIVKGNQYELELPCLFSFETLKLSKWSVNLKKNCFLGRRQYFEMFLIYGSPFPSGSHGCMRLTKC